MTTKNITSKSTSSRISDFFYTTYCVIEVPICLIRDIIFFPRKIMHPIFVAIIWIASILSFLITVILFALEFGEIRSFFQCALFGVIIGFGNSAAHVEKENFQPIIALLSALLLIAVFYFNIAHIPDEKIWWLIWASFFSGIFGYYLLLVREQEVEVEVKK